MRNDAQHEEEWRKHIKEVYGKSFKEHAEEQEDMNLLSKLMPLIVELREENKQLKECLEQARSQNKLWRIAYTNLLKGDSNASLPLSK